MSLVHINQDSTRLIDKYINTSTSSNRLIDSSMSGVVEKCLTDNEDVVQPEWVARHAKFIYENGLAAYFDLAHKARKFGRNPRAYMATLINNAL